MFTIDATLGENPDHIEQAIEKKSRFILATNELDKEKLSSLAFLETYKDQHKVERGFRFLKNPLCMASSVFLKNQKRIVALGFVMMLGLLIYSAIEYSLRRALEEENETVPNQICCLICFFQNECLLKNVGISETVRFTGEHLNIICQKKEGFVLMKRMFTLCPSK